jgi:hypothetical protein
MPFLIAKFLHIIAIGSVALALANAWLGPRASRAGGVVQAELFRLIALFGRAGRIGLLLLWLTGAFMLFDRYGGNPGNLPVSFTWKLGFVALATVAVIVIDYSPLRRHAAVVAIGGLAADIAIVVAIALAVATFN